MSTDDWRLFGQDRYLLGVRLKWKTWRPDRPGWDHDHCAFCMAKISSGPVDGDTEYDAAWVTSNDDYHWVCPVCFEDFREAFRWTVEPDE